MDMELHTHRHAMTIDEDWFNKMVTTYIRSCQATAAQHNVSCELQLNDVKKPCQKVLGH